MDLGIRGRRALVMASSQGLGRACATALAAEGCDEYVNGRHPAKLEAVAQEIRARTGVEVIPVVADLNTESGRAALISACPADCRGTSWGPRFGLPWQAARQSASRLPSTIRALMKTAAPDAAWPTY